MPNPICPLMADLAEPILEGRGYLNDVSTAEDDTEQRIALRSPTLGGAQRSQEYTVTAWASNEHARLSAALYRGQSSVWDVPLWQYSRPLGTAFVYTDNKVYVNPADIEYIVGSRVHVWATSSRSTVRTITALVPGGGSPYVSVDNTGAVAEATYAAATSWAMPCEEGYLAAAIPMTPINGAVSRWRLKFILKSLAAATGSFNPAYPS